MIVNRCMRHRLASEPSREMASTPVSTLAAVRFISHRTQSVVDGWGANTTKTEPRTSRPR